MNAINILLLLLVLPVATAAAECFCLEDKDDLFRHSCEIQQQGPRQVAQCRDDTGKPYKIDDLDGWKKLAAGEGRCNPCRQTINANGGDIRGKDKQQPAKDTANERAQ